MLTFSITCYFCHSLVKFWFTEIKCIINPTWFYYNFIFCIRPSMFLCFIIPASDALYLVYFLFNIVLRSLFLRWYLHFSWQVLNHVWFMIEIQNKWMWEDIVGIKIFWMNNKLYFLYVILTKNLLVVFLFKRMQFLKPNSSINLSFFWSPRDEWSTYIKYFNCSRSTKSYHSGATFYTFLLICVKKISNLVFVGNGGASVFL